MPKIQLSNQSTFEPVQIQTKRDKKQEKAKGNSLNNDEISLHSAVVSCMKAAGIFLGLIIYSLSSHSKSGPSFWWSLDLKCWALIESSPPSNSMMSFCRISKVKCNFVGYSRLRAYIRPNNIGVAKSHAVKVLKHCHTL